MDVYSEKLVVYIYTLFRAFFVLCIHIAYFIELCIFIQNAVAVGFW